MIINFIVNITISARAMDKNDAEFIVNVIVASLGAIVVILALLYFYIWFRYYRHRPGKFLEATMGHDYVTSVQTEKEVT